MPATKKGLGCESPNPLFYLVGTEGFEPSTPCTPCMGFNRPILLILLGFRLSRLTKKTVLCGVSQTLQIKDLRQSFASPEHCPPVLYSQADTIYRHRPTDSPERPPYPGIVRRRQGGQRPEVSVTRRATDPEPAPRIHHRWNTGSPPTAVNSMPWRVAEP